MELEGIPIKSKHVRWNYEQSKDNFHGDIPLTRYYLAIVDNRSSNREEILNKIVDNMNQVNSWVIPVGKNLDFKVKDSEWGLLFAIYDALVPQESLGFLKAGIKSKRDYKLCEKKVLTIEDYLRRIYE